MNPQPRLVYLHGFASGPSSSKARFFAERAADAGVSLEIPDLVEGGFENLTITGQLAVVERTLAGEPAVLFGSSMGGYLAALYAAAHPEAAALILLAPAFDFARRWVERLGPVETARWKETNWLPVFHYGENREARVGYRLLEDAGRYDPYPRVSQPIAIFHGRHDDVVPIGLSEEFVRRTPTAELHALDSDHQLLNVTGWMWEQSRRFLAVAGVHL